MPRIAMFPALAALGMAWLAQPVLAQQQQAGAKGEFTAANIETAINKAVQYILSQQRADGSWEPYRDSAGSSFTDGPTAMAIYTLVASGIPAKDTKIAKALDWLVKPENQVKLTYTTAFRCLAWHTVNKQLDNKYMKNLEADVKLLLNSTADGSYRYASDGVTKAEYGDRSNSQYGLYGVWTGARAGMEIPKEYWEKCLKFWISCQDPSGGWKYMEGQTGFMAEVRHPMTVAGLASLFVCIDQLYMDRFLKCQVSSELAAVKKGMEWMEKNIGNPSTKRYYYLYGLERVGLASGYKYFGATDWYKAGTTDLLSRQDATGSWNSHEAPVPNTCYGLLFLIRGRLPVIINHLEYDGDWNNRPRALANFCRWSEKVFETENNWQIITLKSDVNEWHDAPILAITGSRAPKFSDEEIVKLRTYVHQGGTILSITECNGSAFSTGIKALYQKLFPKYELAPCGKEHPLNNVLYKSISAVRLSEVRNGIRPLVIHTDADLPVSWQTYAVATGRVNFEAAANVVMYVTDKQFKNRGVNVWPSEPAGPFEKTVKIARLKHGGNCDAEPLALERFARLMGKTFRVRIECPAEPIEIASLKDSGVKLAILTGTAAFKLKDDEKATLRDYVEQGGLVFFDSGGGSKSFGDSAKDLIGELWGADSLLAMPLASPVYQLKDMTIEKVKYRRITRARLGGVKEPRLMAILAGDKPKVIFSQEDVMAGLVGFSSHSCDGYEPESALDIMRNIVLYAATAPPPKDAASQPASRPAAVATRPAN
ncbi:MAG: DUF4159 domain-containing protein [Planctomycetes bacterium]|nr:DUF4159 domain-containing protein [Planctomycetota bacterium]